MEKANRLEHLTSPARVMAKIITAYQGNIVQVLLA
jgi:hypothetical protein